MSHLITDICDNLRAQPSSFGQMPDECKAALTEAMRPDKLHGFNGEQAAWIYSWFLLVTAKQLADLQALHPRQYAARKTKNGRKYLSAALLTDAIEGRRLSEAFPIISTLKWYHVDDLIWPKLEPEEDV